MHASWRWKRYEKTWEHQLCQGLKILELFKLSQHLLVHNMYKDMERVESLRESLYFGSRCNIIIPYLHQYQETLGALWSWSHRVQWQPAARAANTCGMVLYWTPSNPLQVQEKHLWLRMGICCVKQQLTEEDIKFLKKHTRYDEETIRRIWLNARP